jgi:hypothetical protein
VSYGLGVVAELFFRKAFFAFLKKAGAEDPTPIVFSIFFNRKKQWGEPPNNHSVG